MRGIKTRCAKRAKRHLLSVVSGWGFPGVQKSLVSLIVRLHYADGVTEDHALKNGEHFLDYIRRADAPGSGFAFPLARRLQIASPNLARTGPTRRRTFGQIAQVDRAQGKRSTIE